MNYSRRIQVVVVAYSGVSLLDIAGPLEAFRAASIYPDRHGRSCAYTATVVSVHGGLVQTLTGAVLDTESVTALRHRRIDTLIVPGALSSADATRDEALIAWIRKRALSCRRVCSVCTGTFLLAAAGLLKGRRAVTHWTACNELAAKYPDVTVEPDAIYVRDGRIWSSAGVSTGIDLALALIEEDCTRVVAMRVARTLVVYLRRMGGQSQYSALLAAQTDSKGDRFSELDRWIAEHLTADLRVHRLALRVAMSPRNFARRYAEVRKRTPARAVEAIRVDAARRELEETDDGIETIARRCGFSDEEQMRAAFARLLRVTPRAYRRRFTTAG